MENLSKLKKLKFLEFSFENTNISQDIVNPLAGYLSNFKNVENITLYMYKNGLKSEVT